MQKYISKTAQKTSGHNKASVQNDSSIDEKKKGIDISVKRGVK